MRLLHLLKSKIHHARISYANPDYIGSIEIDADIMRRVGLVDGEMVHIWAVDHDARVQTYCFAGPPGVVGMNGGAARLFSTGDRVIITAYVLSDEEIDPKIVLLDERNRFVRDLHPYSVVG